MESRSVQPGQDHQSHLDDEEAVAQQVAWLRCGEHQQAGDRRASAKARQRDAASASRASALDGQFSTRRSPRRAVPAAPGCRATSPHPPRAATSSTGYSVGMAWRSTRRGCERVKRGARYQRPRICMKPPRSLRSLPRGGRHRAAGQALMHIHILGICGTFMGGIATITSEAGHEVTGCDTNVYPPMSDQLRALGIELIEGSWRRADGLEARCVSSSAMS